MRDAVVFREDDVVDESVEVELMLSTSFGSWGKEEI